MCVATNLDCKFQKFTCESTKCCIIESVDSISRDGPDVTYTT